MTFILKSTRLLPNLFGPARYSAGFSGKKKPLIFIGCQRILNLNEYSVRSQAVSKEEIKADAITLHEKLDEEFFRLNENVKRRRVFKEDVLKLYENVKETGKLKHSHLMLLLRCCTDVSFMCSEKERIILAKEIWKWAENMGMQFDENHFNALLSVFVKNNHKFSYEKFLKNMEDAGIEANSLIYKKLLRALCQQGDPIKAKILLEKMKELNFPLSEADFNSLVLCYSKIGDFEKVHEILNIMKDRDIDTPSEAYAYLLCGYIENENIDKFLETFNELYETKNIILSNSDLLEIVYALAVKQQNKHIDMVLRKLVKNFLCDKLLSNFLQRILHKNLDSTALKILENFDLNYTTFNFSTSHSRYILEHFARYRNGKEILDMCEELEKRGYVKSPLSYALKRVLILRNNDFSIKLFNQMMARGLPVREHFYWPLIIQASKKGNDELVSFLKKVPKTFIRGFETTYQIILPKFKYSDSREADTEKLLAAGIHEKDIMTNFAFNYLKEEKLDEVEKIVANSFVNPTKIWNIFNLLFGCLRKMPDRVEQVVNIFYCNYIDVYIEEKKLKPIENLSNIFFQKMVTALVENIQEKNTVLRVLEVMLEKGIVFSPDIGSIIVKAFPGQDVEDMVNKLSNPNAKIEIDEALLTSKLKSKALPTTLKDCVFIMLKLVQESKFKEAEKVAENFLQQKKDTSAESLKNITKIYKLVISKVAEKEDEALLEKFFALGDKLELWSSQPKKPGLFVLTFLKWKNTARAVEEFKNIFKSSRKTYACTELFMKLISEGKTKEVNEIVNMLCEAQKKDICFTSMVFCYGVLGKVDKAKEVLETEDFVLMRNHFLSKLDNMVDKNDSKVFENFIEIFKNLENVDSILIPLYKLLSKSYANKNEVDKIKELYSDVKNKNITDQNFLLQLQKFCRNLDATDLYNSIRVNFPKGQTVGYGNINSLNQTDDAEERYIHAINDVIPIAEAEYLAKLFAKQGEVDKVCSLVDKYSFRNKTQKIAEAFVRDNKVDEYFQFLDFFASKGLYKTLIRCFSVSYLVPILKSNDEYYEKYKSLALQCTETTQYSLPVVSFFLTCIESPGKLEDAEKLVEKYSNYFQNVPFSLVTGTQEIMKVSSDVYKNILSSKILRDHFSDYLKDIYDRLIFHKCQNNMLDEALDYVNKAITEKVEVRKNLLIILKSKLEQEGKDFSQLEEYLL